MVSRSLGAILVAILGLALSPILAAEKGLEIKALTIVAPDSVRKDYVEMLLPEIKPGTLVSEEELEGLLSHLENRLKSLNISYDVKIIPKIDDDDNLNMAVEIGDGFFHIFGFKGETLAAHYGYENLFNDFIIAETYLGYYEQSFSFYDPALDLSPLYYRLSLGHENKLKEFLYGSIELGLRLHPDFSVGLRQSFSLVENSPYYESGLVIAIFDDSWIEHSGLRIRASIEPEMVYNQLESALKLGVVTEERMYLTPDISFGVIEGLGSQTLSNLPGLGARVLDSQYLGNEVTWGQELRLEARASLRFDNILNIPMFGISSFTLGLEPLYQVQYEKNAGDNSNLRQSVGALANFSFTKPIGIAFKIGALFNIDNTKAIATFYFTQEDL